MFFLSSDVVRRLASCRARPAPRPPAAGDDASALGAAVGTCADCPAANGAAQTPSVRRSIRPNLDEMTSELGISTG